MNEDRAAFMAEVAGKLREFYPEEQVCVRERPDLYVGVMDFVIEVIVGERHLIRAVSDQFVTDAMDPSGSMVILFRDRFPEGGEA